jgi:hypothetical protein
VIILLSLVPIAVEVIRARRQRAMEGVRQ